MRMFLFAARWLLRLLYIPFLPLRPRDKVVMLSRESDGPPLDFLLLEKELKRRSPETEVVYFCKKMTKSVNLIGCCLLILRSLYHIATASVAVTDTYCIQLSVLPKKKGLTVIQLWHAAGAVKKFSYQCLDTENGRSSALAKAMRMHKNYDYVLCAGEAVRAVYAEGFRVPPEAVLVKGMPRVDYLLRRPEGERERLLSQRPDLGGKRLLLYLPTWREGLEEGLEALLSAAAGKEGVALLVQPHPLSRLFIPAEHRVPEGWNTWDLMRACDGVITDYSAASLEASLLRKPVYFYLFDYERYRSAQGLNIDLPAELPGAVAMDAGALAEKLEEAYDLEALERFSKRYISTAGTDNTGAVAELLLEHLPAPPPAPAAA